MSTENMNTESGFTAERFRGRLTGFAWVIIEKRDPNFDGEQLKKENLMSLLLKATSFAQKEECDTIIQLMEKMESSPSGNDDNNLLEMKGALEGKLVIYGGKSPSLLLLDEEI